MNHLLGKAQRERGKLFSQQHRLSCLSPPLSNPNTNIHPNSSATEREPVAQMSARDNLHKTSTKKYSNGTPLLSRCKIAYQILNKKFESNFVSVYYLNPFRNLCKSLCFWAHLTSAPRPVYAGAKVEGGAPAHSRREGQADTAPDTGEPGLGV